LSAPSGTGRLPRVLRDDELEALLAPRSAAGDPDEPRELRDLAVVELLYGSGLRVAELCRLELGDLDLDGRLAHVTGKGDKQRRVPLSEPSVAALRRWLDAGRGALTSPDEPASSALFLNARGRALGPRDV